MLSPYRGRFAPSPTGPLHAGSLVAAVASWLDARAHGGAWLVRIEDVDTPRCLPGAEQALLAQLAACGLVPDEPPLWQSTRGAAYAQALQSLLNRGLAYACSCTRRDIEAVWAARGSSRPRFGELVYPGTCRDRSNNGGDNVRDSVRNSVGTSIGDSLGHNRPRAIRLRVDGAVRWHDRRLGAQQQDVAAAVGDFVLRRADGLWAYQLAVVVDDAAQGITDVVRGVDLADNTARQIVLQRALQLPTPRHLHTPLVLGADGHKLSKQNGARALDVAEPLAALQAAGAVLGLPHLQATTPARWLSQAVPAWAGIITRFASPEIQT